MPDVNGIEFFQYPSRNPVWGIRVDGTDLRARAAWATRELWRPELEDQFEDQERESADLLWGQHAGLDTTEFTDTAFLPAAPDPVPLLGCRCGVWRCWPLTARITATATTITWSGF